MKSPAYQFYPDKWQTDTRRLSWEAKGIFHELCCVVWLQFQETCCFPDDDKFIASEIGCTIEEWQRTKAELLNPHRPILKKTETNRFLIPGLLKEQAKQVERREKLRQNGMLGGRPKNQKVISEEPKVKPGTGNQNESLPSPSPSPLVERESNFSEVPPMSRKDFDAMAEMRAVPKECAEWFWNVCDSRNWTDKHGQPIRKVEPLLLNAVKSWQTVQAQKGGCGGKPIIPQKSLMLKIIEEI